MCMRLDCNPHIIFVTFFRLNLVSFWFKVSFWLNFYQNTIGTGYLVNATPTIFSSPEPKAPSELIGWDSSRRP